MYKAIKASELVVGMVMVNYGRVNQVRMLDWSDDPANHGVSVDVDGIDHNYAHLNFRLNTEVFIDDEVGDVMLTVTTNNGGEISMWDGQGRYVACRTIADESDCEPDNFANHIKSMVLESIYLFGPMALLDTPAHNPLNLPATSLDEDATYAMYYVDNQRTGEMRMVALASGASCRKSARESADPSRLIFRAI